MNAEGSLRVLVVAEDRSLAGAVAQVVKAEGDSLTIATSIDDALASATSSKFDVAFVELALAGGAALALCHHLPSVSPGVVVHALVSATGLERGADALSLGAAGVIVGAPTGDALARVLADLKSEAVRTKQIEVLEGKLARERRRLETYDRLVRFARGAAQSDAVRAIVDGVSQLSGAKGVALYATFGDDELVEVTPRSVRLRKRVLDHSQRKPRRTAEAA